MAFTALGLVLCLQGPSVSKQRRDMAPLREDKCCNRFSSVLTQRVLSTLPLSKIQHGNYFTKKQMNLWIKNSVLLHSYNLGGFVEKITSFIHVAETNKSLFFHPPNQRWDKTYHKISLHGLVSPASSFRSLPVATRNPANPPLCMKMKRSFLTAHLERLSKNFSSKPCTTALWKRYEIISPC